MPDAPDPDYDPNSATIPLSGPRPTLSGSNVDLPLPEELAKLLPAGAYELTGFLGAGGMGAVYKGMQIRLKRPVAIKIMRRDMGKDHDFEARFEREAQAMAKLNHPNIISVIDFGEAGPDYLFIVMELVDGTDLMDVIRSKQMTQEMALTLLPQICDALQFAHDHGIVHRDIKPSNIMLTRDGRVKMADFGLAKHFDHAESGFRTQTGTGMGTPDYAAPEQFDPTTQVDHRADIYALGVMIYQMITGALPCGVWRPPSQRAEVSTHWDAVVSRAMQNDPAERYQKASEVKTELSSIPLANAGRAASPKQPSPAPPQSGALGQSALPKSKATLLFGLIVGAVVIAVGAFFALRDTAPRNGGFQPPSQGAPGTVSSDAAPLTTTATVSIPGLPDLPPLTVPPGEPGLVKAFTLSGSLVRSLHVLPDSRRLLIVQDDMITLYDLETEKKVWFIEGGKGSVSSAINGDGTRFVNCDPFDAAGKALVAPGPDGGYFEIKLHETATGNLLHSWKVPYTRMSNAVSQIALSPSGKTIVVRTGGYENGTAKEASTFLALEIGKIDPVAKWTAADHMGMSTHALSDTLFLSTGGGVPFQMNTANPSAKWKDLGDFADARYASALSHDKRWLIVSKGSFFGAWDMTTRKLLRPFDSADRGFGFGVFAGNDLVVQKQSGAEGVDRKKIQVWDRATGILLAEYAPSKPGFLWDSRSAGALNGQFFVNVVAPSPTAPNKDERILQIWRLPKPGQAHGLVKTAPSQPAAATSAAGTASSSPSVPTSPSSPAVSIPGLPDLPPLTIPPGEPGQVKEYPLKDRANRMHILPDSRRLLLFMTERTKLIDLDTGSAVWDINDSGTATASAINQDGTRYADFRPLDADGSALVTTGPAAVKARITLHSTATGEVLQTWTVPLAPMSSAYDQIALSPSGMTLLARTSGATDRGGSTFLSLKLGQTEPIGEWTSPGHTSHVIHALSETMFISTGGGLPFQIKADDPAWRNNDLGGLAEVKYQSTLSPSKRWLVATLGSSCSIWDMSTRRPLHALADSQFAFSYGVFAGDDMLLRHDSDGKVAKHDDVMRAWERTTGRLLATYLPTRPDYRFSDLVAGAPNGTFFVNAATPLPSATDQKQFYLQIWRLPKPGQVHELVKTPPSQPAAAPAITGTVSSTPSSATKEAPFTNSLGMKFVPVPTTGGPTDKQRVLFSVWDTRVQDYEAYVAAMQADGSWKTQQRDGVPAGREPDHPVVGVNWDDAQAFCQWLTVKETAEGKLPQGMKYRLPSDEEWSWAVGLPSEPGETPEERHLKNSVDFPWGKDWPPTKKVGNYADETFHAKFPVKQNENENRDESLWMKDCDDGYATTSPVGSFPANTYGLYDMGGNVWQWCEDWRNTEHKDRVLRGASWGIGDRRILRSSYRHGFPATNRNSTCGFRIVLAPVVQQAAVTPATASEDAPFINTLGMKFVPVPITGGPTDKQRVLFSVWETRVQEYEAFVKETKHEWPKPDFPYGPTHPAVNVTRGDAQSFCTWLTEKEHLVGRLGATEHYRLPADHEWSCAVGIGTRENPAQTPSEKSGKVADVFPWGTTWPPPSGAGNLGGGETTSMLPSKAPNCIESYRDDFLQTASVGSFPANVFGLFDLCGNVWELCSEPWESGVDPDYVARGGSWGLAPMPSTLLSSNRYHANNCRATVGFRVVLAPATPTP